MSMTGLDSHTNLNVAEDPRQLTLLGLKYNKRNTDVPKTVSDHMLANAFRLVNLNSSRSSSLSG